MHRRSFVRTAAAASVAPLIVPRHVLGGVGFVAPSDTVAVGIIGQPHPNLHEAMEREHTKRADSDVVFETGNYGGGQDSNPRTLPACCSFAAISC